MELADLGDLETISVEATDDDVLVVTLNRPDRLNAINTEMIDELFRVVGAVDIDPKLRAVVLTGAGRGFCAGADLSGNQTPAPGAEGTGRTVTSLSWQDHLANLHERIHRSRKPWIAAVNGPAVGGGFSLSLACDVRFAAESARFGAVFITIGVSNCDMGTSYFLPRLVGASRAAELMLTGRIFEASEASEIGLVTEIMADGSVVERALACANQIAANSPFAVWMTKETMWQTIDSPSLRHALDMENRTQIVCSTSDGFADASTAFMEGRKPVWDGL